MTPRRELQWAMSHEIAELLRAALLPDGVDPESERGVIGIVRRSTGFRRTTLLLQQVVVPRDGEVTWDRRAGLLFAPSYKSRASNAVAQTVGAGIAFIHTHPGSSRSSFAPAPSSQDLESDAADLFYIGASLRDGVPLVAGILAANGLWSVRQYTFAFPSSASEARLKRFSPFAGKVHYASATRVVGPGVRSTGQKGSLSAETQDSSIRLWGGEGQRALSTLRVGIVGAGGVGGILSEHVARLGVGETVHVDFDVINEANLNRAQGATRMDAKRQALKTTVASRLAKMAATAIGFSARQVEGSVVDKATLPHLLDCDIILNAADSPWARQVLDHLAFSHLIPVINGGTTLRGTGGQLAAGKCEVSATGPGHPCSECAGVYTRSDVTEAQESPNVRGQRRYIETGMPIPVEVREPSVISFNALVAGLMQLRMQALVLSTTSDAAVGIQRYYPLEGTMSWASIRECKPDCERRSTIGLGDAYELPLGVDLDFEQTRNQKQTSD